MSMIILPPPQGTYAPFYDGYVKQIAGKDPIKMLESQVLGLKALLSEIPSEKEDYAYAPGKWTIKQVIGHIIDTERIMTYRALAIARGEKKPLPGFDENEYVAAARFNERSLYDLGHEFGAVREATIALFKSLNNEELDRLGNANNHPVSARALLYIIVGHHIHHEHVLRERYIEELD